MGNTYRYEAFGSVLSSEYPIAQLPFAAPGLDADVFIREADLSGYGISEGCYRIDEQSIIVSLAAVGTFRISEGTYVDVQPHPSCTLSNLGVYLMGTCMGAILHQRDYMPLHGSCVTNGQQSVLIIGDSGAGKSTLAAEFLSKGWKLVTDDVCAVFDVDGTPMVQSGYPSQKLWQDSLQRYALTDDVHSLYFSEKREKFGVNVAGSFFRGTCPLNMIVRLILTQSPCSISSVDGITRLDQLMQNTYRIFMVPPKHRQRHFQRCAALGEKVPMVLLTRQEGIQCAETLYDLILTHLI